MAIVVRERVPALDLTAPGGGYDLVDGDGVVVRWSARPAPGLPLYLTGVPVAALPGNPDVAAAAAVLMRSRMSYYDVSAPGSVLAR